MSKCTAKDCERLATSGGVCGAHRARQRRGIDSDKPLRKYSRGNPDMCSFEDCGRPHFAKGYCWSHHRMEKLGQELKPVRNYNRRVAETD